MANYDTPMKVTADGKRKPVSRRDRDLVVTMIDMDHGEQGRKNDRTGRL
jgi:hypothetical protein